MDKQIMIDKMMITCSDATMYVSKREEGKLSFQDRFKLFLHLAICKFCRLFAIQNKMIIKEIKHIHSEATLTDLEKEQIQAKILENNSSK
ncbi:MAG: hypothetical protein A2237_01360 [Stygiobacter sp. RIFOXYA2_FULL_38_8]|nr:MAG: hypothetical protein A2237_01360 [Stygiobacter sp. RIFOXYA2_FULL_38_8]